MVICFVYVNYGCESCVFYELHLVNIYIAENFVVNVDEQFSTPLKKNIHKNVKDTVKCSNSADSTLIY